MASIQNFKSALITGGARANQFEVVLNLPKVLSDSGFTITQKEILLCKGASLPASSIADVPVPYRGKTVHLAGERTYAPWTATFFNTITVDSAVSLYLRELFETWQSYIQNYSTIDGEVIHSDYVASIDIRQLDRKDRVAYEYKLVNAWPSEIGEIALDYSSENVIEEFPVTFTYDYFVSTATLNNTGDNASFVDEEIVAVSASEV